MPEDGLLAIGELARRTGVATSALRYYERIGLLSPAARAGQRRQFTPASAERIAPSFRSALEARSRRDA